MDIISAMKRRIVEGREAVARYESTDPHTAGQVRRAVGGVLVADGLVGLEVPGGRRTRPGLVGALGGVVFGLVFVAIGLFLANAGPDTDSSTSGTVVSTDRQRDSDGDTVCGLTAVFTVDGREYRADSTGRSDSNCSKVIGDSVRVNYSAADPTRGETDDPTSAWFPWVFVGVGAMVALSSIGTAVVRGVSVVAGLRLVSSGTRLAREHPRPVDDGGAVEAARRAVTESLRGLGGGGRFSAAVRHRHAVAGPVGASPAGPDAGHTPASAPDPVLAPSEPAIPPGWYPTADGRHDRWHDGTAWTPHVRPAAAPG